jgi:hypothetical protein
MIFGKKSDLKNHLSMKKPSWSHHVVARNPLEQDLEMKSHEESAPENESPSRAERSEPMQSRS